MVKLRNFAIALHGFTLTLLLFCNISLSAAYRYNPDVPRETWQEVKPYFLPENHVIKEQLDKIFKKRRVIESRDSLRDAHFRVLSESEDSHMYVLRHKHIDGYIFKVYTDFGIDVDDSKKWLKRIHGAEAVRNHIKANDYDIFFKLPRKWIYPVPVNPAPNPSLKAKYFILVEEDMHLVEKKENKKLWDSPVVDKPFLDALFDLVTTLGMTNATMPKNIPFSEDGKIAFIDTEISNTWPVQLDQLNKHLSSEMKSYWKKKIKAYKKANKLR